MKFVRFLLAITIIAYAAWLAWPFVSPFFEGAAPEAAITRSTAAVAMDSGGSLPVAALWVGAVALYFISAILLGAGNARAAIAYFLGFMGDIVLRLALRPGAESGASPLTDGEVEIFTRSMETAPSGGPDLQWLVIGALMFAGLLVLALTRRNRRTPEMGAGEAAP